MNLYLSTAKTTESISNDDDGGVMTQMADAEEQDEDLFMPHAINLQEGIDNDGLPRKYFCKYFYIWIYDIYKQTLLMSCLLPVEVRYALLKSSTAWLEPSEVYILFDNAVLFAPPTNSKAIVPEVDGLYRVDMDYCTDRNNWLIPSFTGSCKRGEHHFNMRKGIGALQWDQDGNLLVEGEDYDGPRYRLYRRVYRNTRVPRFRNLTFVHYRFEQVPAPAPAQPQVQV